MLQQPQIKEVILWMNHDLLIDQFYSDPPHLRVLHSPQNLCTHARYLAIARARYDIIATCDDDVMVQDWQTLFREYERTKRITTYLDPGHYNLIKDTYIHKYNGGEAHETLVGYGSVFHKAHAHVLDDYKSHFGEDEVLHRKSDRIFTILQNEPHNNIMCDVTHMQGAWGSEALYRQNDHVKLNRIAYKRCQYILNY